jgi:hypothetical protein
MQQPQRPHLSIIIGLVGVGIMIGAVVLAFLVERF